MTLDYVKRQWANKVREAFSIFRLVPEKIHFEFGRWNIFRSPLRTAPGRQKKNISNFGKASHTLMR